MFGLFKKKGEPEISSQAKYLIELFKRDGWGVHDRYDRYLRGKFGGTYIEVATKDLWSNEFCVRVGSEWFGYTDRALHVPLGEHDHKAIWGPFHELNDRLCNEVAKREDAEAVELLTRPHHHRERTDE